MKLLVRLCRSLGPDLAEMKAMIQGLQAPVQPKEGQQQDIQALVKPAKFIANIQSCTTQFTK